MDLPWTVLKIIQQETSEKAKDIEKTLLRPLHKDPCLVKRTISQFSFQESESSSLKVAHQAFIVWLFHTTDWLHPAPFETANSLHTEKPTTQSLK